MWHTERDYMIASPLSRLSLVRTYNSSLMNPDADLARTFGVRWTQPYDTKLEAHSEVIAAAPKCRRFANNQIVFCDWYPLANGVMPESASIVRWDGKRTMFNRVGTTWVSVGKTSDRLTATLSTDGSAITAWLYTAAAGDRQERFSGDGKLLSITERNGAVQKFTYATGLNNDSSVERLPADAPICPNVQSGVVVPAGSLLCVTDQSGRQVQFEYTASGLIKKAVDPAGKHYLYEYDGPSGGCETFDAENLSCSARNLTKVTYPDGKSRVYFYNEQANVNYGTACANTKSVAPGRGHLLNSLTGLQDENGARYITWSYNCIGQAAMSTLADGVEKVQIGYAANVQYVRHTVGPANAPTYVQRTFSPTVVNGVVYNASIGGQCAGCGSYANRSYDAVGNVKAALDWKGNYTCMRYDALNRKVAVIEGGGQASCSTLFSATTLTAPAKKTSTVWHASFNLPSIVAEPLRRTGYQYDTSGNLLSVTVQATSDATGVLGISAASVGAPRVKQFTYNAAGQIKTVTGPRADVSAVTLMDYDVDGNLTRVTNPAGHVVQLSNYDVHGRARRITDPNGLVTEIVYNERGWVTSTTVGAETTFYTHDGIGQVTTVTKAGTPTLSYFYDDAHRLTGIVDSLHNSITFTLDLTGNRIREEIKDPNGMLSRQVVRVYDVLNQLQNVTGAQQ
jgi:YD repeat-containing protein